MWPRKSKKTNLESTQKGLESLKVSEQDQSPKENSEMNLDTPIEKPTREKYRLSPEDVQMLQKDVYKKRDADQELFEMFQKVVRKMVQDEGNLVEEKSGSSEVEMEF